MQPWKKQLLSSPTASMWKHIGVLPHHGINIFLPALHSKHSSGIGEFFDLLPIIDWCHELKMDVIQLLPLNNSDHDPSPYNPMSCCALNFLFLSLHALPFLDRLSNLKKRLKTLTEFNQTQRIAYADVIVHKTSWLQAYFDEVGNEVMKGKPFQHFLAHNAWLKPFALFHCLKNHLNNTSWMSWPEDLKNLSKETYKHLLNVNANRIHFTIVLQFLCYSQLKEVKRYANSKNIFLKGDIPILVNAESVDAWQHPDYFNMQYVAGAPPDKYYAKGQYWGFPTFKWEAIRKDHFSWWKQRLKYASEFFDLFRIDHVVGFFRLWTIPLHSDAKQGRYVPDNDQSMIEQGKELLQMIVSFSRGMLPIAEDLGVIPDIVPIILQEMGICGTKVMRWERKWKEDKHFIPFSSYNPISLTCVSTHDSNTLTQWWKAYDEDVKEFSAFKKWTYTPELTFLQRSEILWDSHHTGSLFHINLLQEYLSLFSELVWPHPDDERINIPGTILSTNWTYRYRPSVEEMTSHVKLKEEMQKILFSPLPNGNFNKAS